MLEIETVDYGAVDISTIKDEETIHNFGESPPRADNVTVAREAQPSPEKKKSRNGTCNRNHLRPDESPNLSDFGSHDIIMSVRSSLESKNKLKGWRLKPRIVNNFTGQKVKITPSP
jgi:hypothetical protein